MIGAGTAGFGAYAYPNDVTPRVRVVKLNETSPLGPGSFVGFGLREVWHQWAPYTHFSVGYPGELTFLIKRYNNGLVSKYIYELRSRNSPIEVIPFRPLTPSLMSKQL